MRGEVENLDGEVKELREEIKELRAQLAVAQASLELLDIPADEEERILEDAKRVCLEDDENDWIARHIKEVKSLY